MNKPLILSFALGFALIVGGFGLGLLLQDVDALGGEVRQNVGPRHVILRRRPNLFLVGDNLCAGSQNRR